MADKSRANDRQVGGTHYKGEGKVEHWDIVAQWGLDYFQGQITKYVMRWRAKGGIQDLEKARHFLDKYIELEKAKVEAEVPQVPTGDQGPGEIHPRGSLLEGYPVRPCVPASPFKPSY